MKTGRDKKIAEEIRREVSQIFNFELGDPRIQGVTVTGVKMTPDLKLARVYFALPGMSDKAEETEKVLKKSSQYIRRLLAKRILIKYIPQIEFFYDESFEIETRMDEIFREMGEVSSEEDR